MPSMALSKAAELFVQFQYPEWKDLAKSFITLSSATLVLSLTFSDKIINFNSARVPEKRVMFLAWCFFILSIVSCGLAICSLSWAQSYAVRQIAFPYEYILSYGKPYYYFAFWSTCLLVATGCLYTAGLIALIVAAFLAMSADARAISDQPPVASGCVK